MSWKSQYPAAENVILNLPFTIGGHHAQIEIDVIHMGTHSKIYRATIGNLFGYRVLCYTWDSYVSLDRLVSACNNVRLSETIRQARERLKDIEAMNDENAIEYVRRVYTQGDPMHSEADGAAA